MEPGRAEVVQKSGGGAFVKAFCSIAFQQGFKVTVECHMETHPNRSTGRVTATPGSQDKMVADDEQAYRCTPSMRINVQAQPRQWLGTQYRNAGCLLVQRTPQRHAATARMVGPRWVVSGSQPHCKRDGAGEAALDKPPIPNSIRTSGGAGGEIPAAAAVQQ